MILSFQTPCSISSQNIRIPELRVLCLRCGIAENHICWNSGDEAVTSLVAYCAARNLSIELVRKVVEMRSDMDTIKGRLALWM